MQQQLPPPPYYEPLPPIRSQTTIIQAQSPPVFIMQQSYGNHPTRSRCPNCHADIVTQIKHESGLMTWLLCGAICALGLFVPCAWFGCN